LNPNFYFYISIVASMRKQESKLCIVIHRIMIPSPPRYTFDLANVNDVRCSSLESRHFLEIEAMVCDDSCSLDGFEN